MRGGVFSIGSPFGQGFTVRSFEERWTISSGTAAERPRDPERIRGDYRGGVELHRADVRGAVGRVPAVYQVDYGKEAGPVLVRGGQRRHVEGDVEGADAEAVDVAVEQRPHGPREVLVVRPFPDHDDLLLLDRREACERPD